MRHKEIHILKVHPTVKFSIDFVIAKASEKMAKRFFLHRSVEDVRNVIDNKLLPAEYGGVTPIQEMIQSFKKELEAQRELIMMFNDLSVNEKLYPQAVLSGSVRSFEKPIEEYAAKNDSKEFSHGIQGSFRKLEFD